MDSLTYLLWKRKYLWLIVVLVAANAVIVLIDLSVLRYLSAVLLLFLLPGLVLIELMERIELAGDVGWVERLTLGCGLSYVLSSLSTLILHYLPGPMSMASILLACDLLTLVPLLLILVRPYLRGNSRLSFNFNWSLVVLLVVAALPRLVFLGYSEFQGDEAGVMFKAAQAIVGQDHALFAHSKGPAEILLPTGFWLLAGRIDEFGARLPFALAGLLGVTALYGLGERLFNRRVGFLAALLLAVNGYFVGFGRIVQYQSLVLAMSGLALWCAYRFRADRAGGHALLSGLFLGFSLLSHYDAVVVLPAALYLLAGRWVGGKKWLALCLLLLVAVPMLFYPPFVADQQFVSTYGYLKGGRLGQNLLVNNLPSFLVLSTVYNSTYYLVFLLPLLGWAVLAALSRLDVGRKACFIWLAVPAVFYLFIVAKPLTHFYTLFPAWTLLAGLALDEIDALFKRIKWAMAGRAVFVVLYLIFAWYIFLVFVWHDPEYKRTYPAHKLPFYWTVYAELPPEGYFGFPYRAGWKVVGELYRTGALQGDYLSNEEDIITFWYARNASRACPDDAPDYYLIAENVQDEQPIGHVPGDCVLAGTVLVEGNPKLRIYRHPQARAEFGPLSARDYEADFDRRTTPRNVAGKPAIDHPLNIALEGPSGQVQLLGYDLDTSRAQPGGSLRLTLYWQVEKRLSTNYYVFSHLETDRIWGQSDGVPVCHNYPTNAWRPSTVIVDRRRLPIAPETPPGRYPLTVGLYEPESGQRLDVLDQAGNPQGNSVLLQEVVIEGK
ncbi:MAG: ArnT family glycosyltransferase [Anaerolineae bacterium]